MAKIIRDCGRLLAAALIFLPLTGFSLTGTLVIPYTFQGVAAGDGHGKIAVKFDRASDATHPTQWRLVSAEGPGAWTAVTKATVTTLITKRAQTYGMEFRRTTATPRDTAPAARTVTIVEGQQVIIKVRYQ